VRRAHRAPCTIRRLSPSTNRSTRGVSRLATTMILKNINHLHRADHRTRLGGDRTTISQNVQMRAMPTPAGFFGGRDLPPIPSSPIPLSPVGGAPRADTPNSLSRRELTTRPGSLQVTPGEGLPALAGVAGGGLRWASWSMPTANERHASHLEASPQAGSDAWGSTYEKWNSMAMTNRLQHMPPHYPSRLWRHCRHTLTNRANSSRTTGLHYVYHIAQTLYFHVPSQHRGW